MRNPWGMFLLCLGVVAFFLWAEQRAESLRAFPYLVLLLCPVLHFLMHRRPGGHGDHGQGKQKRGDP